MSFTNNLYHCASKHQGRRISWFRDLFSYGSELVDYHESVISTPDTLDQTSVRPELSVKVFKEWGAGKGRVWEAIIKAGDILLSECNTCEVDSYLGNTSWLTVVTVSCSFAFCGFKKKIVFFTWICFQFVHSLEKSLRGFCSFSLKCARRLSETQTLPSDPLQEPHPQKESPLFPVEDTTIICKSLFLSAFSEWSIVSPQERQKQLPLMEGNEDGLGDSLAGLGMFGRRTLVLCQSGTRNGLSRKDALLWSQPVWGECSQPRSAALCGGDDFTQCDLESVCSVVGHFLLFVESSFQLGNMKRCFDAVAEGLQPSHFSSFHPLLMNTLLSKLGTVFFFLTAIPAFLHSVLVPEFSSCLAKSPALLVFLAGTLASIPVVCCFCRK